MIFSPVYFFLVHTLQQITEIQILNELPQESFNPIVSSCILGLEISHQGRRDVGAVGTFAT